MYQGLLHLHSGIPYLLLLGLVLSVILFYTKAASGKTFGKGDKALALVTLILAHLQLVAGIALYFVSPIVTQAFESGEVMSDSTYRFYAVEHLITMLIAITLITIGYSKGKRKTEAGSKFKTLALFYLLGLIVALIRIPWDAWLGI
jgi:hypothetical protein